MVKLEDMTMEELILDLRLETEEIKRRTARHAELLAELWSRTLPRQELDAALTIEEVKPKQTG